MLMLLSIIAAVCCVFCICGLNFKVAYYEQKLKNSEQFDFVCGSSAFYLGVKLFMDIFK